MNIPKIKTWKGREFFNFEKRQSVSHYTGTNGIDSYIGDYKEYEIVLFGIHILIAKRLISENGGQWTVEQIRKLKRGRN